VVQNSKAVATGNPTTAKEVAAVDVADSLMTSSQADMVGVKLTIIGDPDYIKQDDAFYQGQPTASTTINPTIDSRLLPNGGSLVMDEGGLYVQILFKIPRDIDDSTGFMKYDADQRNSVFSGLYQVNTVVSNFSQGKFIQTLELNRLPRQVAFDYVGGNNNKSNARPATSTVPDVLGVAVDASTTSTDNVAGGSSAPSTADAADSATNQIAGQDQPAAQTNNAEQPAETQEQKDLKAVKDTAPTVAISEANQPPPVPPEPKPTEARKAADKEYFDFIASNPSSPEKIAAANYDTLGSRIRSEQEVVETIQKNIERFDLRLARSDITEEQRKTFTELKEKEAVRLETRRRGIQDDEAERNLLKPVADAYNARVKELDDARRNIS